MFRSGSEIGLTRPSKWMVLISLRKVLICTSHRPILSLMMSFNADIYIAPLQVGLLRSAGATRRWQNGVMIFLGFVFIQVHGGPPPPRNGKHGAAQVECQPEAHRDTNRLVNEGKVPRCNWHCHRPVRRVKAGSASNLALLTRSFPRWRNSAVYLFDHRPVPCALPLKGYGMAG